LSDILNQSEKNKKVSILGCGWLAAPLVNRLAEASVVVKASTTTPAKTDRIRNAGAEPFIVNISDHVTKVPPDFFESDFLIISIPPGAKKSGSDHHYTDIAAFISQYKSVLPEQVIYLSSTSVYPDQCRTVDETEAITLENTGSKVLLRTEQLLLEKVPGIQILRLGGLTGPDRMLIKYFAGKKELKGGNSPVNLLHREDGVEILFRIINSDPMPGIWNVCSPLHPLRKDFYTKLATDHGYPLPEYISEDDESWKIVSSEKIIRKLYYRFRFPDPMEYLYGRV
jgi:nucleoside-diphosphate-sugar epimerase